MDSLTLWTWSLAAGGVVIVVVALLLIAILRTARSIDRHLLDIWNAGKNIAGNTVSIWMLGRTNEVARGILERAESIDGTLKQLARAPGR